MTNCYGTDLCCERLHLNQHNFSPCQVDTHIEYIAYSSNDYLVSCEFIADNVMYICLSKNTIHYISMAAYNHMETIGSSP